MKRSAGILMSVSSLPSENGIGCFDIAAYDFVDFLSKAGQSYWQILPLGPTGYGDSPFQSFSSYAGNPYYISLDDLKKKGLLSEADIANCQLEGDGTAVDYKKQYENRLPLLKKAYSNYAPDEDFISFCRENPWLRDYSLFMALKDKFGGVVWTNWENDAKMRLPHALQKYEKELEKETGFYKFLQFCFWEQWNALKKYANEKGIKIIGDVPIYVALDSSDVWISPELFQLDENKQPANVAGCPPDSFSPEGQKWGNPLYDWKKHRETDFRWWAQRLAYAFSLYDVVRIDHFRGFDEYYSIPYGDETAENGKWEKGPGIELFKAVEKHIGKREYIAEDLGFLTDSVKMLVYGSGFPGMKVLEFAFDSRDENNHNDYLPHNYTENCVAYTGTHDNQTLFSWFDTITNDERQAAIDYLDSYGIEPGGLSQRFVSALMQSKAKLCIVPFQDWLGLDDRSRMNTPSTLGENWKWRACKDDINEELCMQIRKLTEKYGRVDIIDK